MTNQLPDVHIVQKDKKQFVWRIQQSLQNANLSKFSWKGKLSGFLVKPHERPASPASSSEDLAAAPVHEYQQRKFSDQTAAQKKPGKDINSSTSIEGVRGAYDLAIRDAKICQDGVRSSGLHLVVAQASVSDDEIDSEDENDSYFFTARARSKGYASAPAPAQSEMLATGASGCLSDRFHPCLECIEEVDYELDCDL